MSQEDRKLLLIDLCARLPYGVKIEGYKLSIIVLNADWYLFMINHTEYDIRRPYLRPMSSMTNDEYNYVYNGHIQFWQREDYCNKHHLDYRGLIRNGLALEAPEDMYKFE